METLAAYIAARLAEKKYCTVFGNEIKRVWPMSSAAADRRNAEIEAFAKARGWTAKINDPGIRVTFRRMEPATAGSAPAAARNIRGLARAVQAAAMH